MQPVYPHGFPADSIKTLGAPAGMSNCDPLPVVIGESDDHPVMLSRWSPSLAERQRLLEGHDVWLWVWGRAHPPVAVEVGLPIDTPAHITAASDTP